LAGNRVAIQSNAMPAGGPAAQQPVPAALTPADINALVEEMVPAVARFRSQSSPLEVPLDSQILGLGGQAGIRIASVGLGYRVITHVTAILTLQNTSGGAQVVSFSPRFPYNLIVNEAVQINGGATVYSASGPASLGVWARTRRGFFIDSLQGGFGPALNPAICQIATVNATVTNAGAARGINAFGVLSGIASISIAAATTATITADFYIIEKLALDRDSLLGALPLQNNSTYATLTRTAAASLVGPNGTNLTPFSTAGAVPGTLIPAVTSITIKSTYQFWSVPSDPGLYQEMVQNSYQVQEQTGLSIAATGPTGLIYNVPQNQYLVAAHILANDNNGAFMTPDFLSRVALQYNAGGVIPVNRFQDRMRADQFSDYGADLAMLPGYILWDGDATAESVISTDQAGWVDTYAAATPQLVADVKAALVTPLAYSLTRESVVAGAVQVVGG